MNTILEFIIYDLRSGILLFGFLTLLLSISISLIEILFILAFSLLVIILLLLVSSIFLPVAVFFGMPCLLVYCLFQYYPGYTRKIRKNILEKPNYLLQQYYLKPLSNLSTQTISMHTYYFILIGVSIATLALLFLIYNVLHHGAFTAWNKPIYYSIRTLRSPTSDAFWIKISLLNSFSMSVLWGVITGYFIIKKDTWRAIHWILLGLLVGGMTAGLKYGTAIPRPGAIFPIKDTFPSAHTTSHMTLLGGLIILSDLHRGTKRWVRLLTYAFYGIWIYLIAFSRLYFAAHWLTDIIGGVLVSLISLGIFSLSYYRRLAVPFVHRELRLVSLSSLSGLWLMRFLLEYDRILKFYMASF